MRRERIHREWKQWRQTLCDDWPSLNLSRYCICVVGDRRERVRDGQRAGNIVCRVMGGGLVVRSVRVLQVLYMLTLLLVVVVVSIVIRRRRWNFFLRAEGMR